MENEDAVTALSALGHHGRLSAFRHLVQAGSAGLPAGELARRLAMPPNTLSTNLNILSAAGLVRSKRDGRSIIYNARFDFMTELLTYLIEDCCAGTSEVCVPLAQGVLRSACDEGARG